MAASLPVPGLLDAQVNQLPSDKTARHGKPFVAVKVELPSEPETAPRDIEPPASKVEPSCTISIVCSSPVIVRGKEKVRVSALGLAVSALNSS